MTNRGWRNRGQEGRHVPARLPRGGGAWTRVALAMVFLVSGGALAQQPRTAQPRMAALPPAPVAPQDGGTAPVATHKLKFKNMPLDLVLRDYAEKTKRTVLQGPGLPNVNITLESQTDLTLEEYLDAIETVLGMNGVGILKVQEKFLKVVPIAQVRQEPMPIKEDLPEPGDKEADSLVSQMIPLKYIDIGEATKAISPLKHNYGQIHPLDRSNAILVTDSIATVNRIIQILKFIDQPVESLEVPNIIQIRFTKASMIKQKLEEVIADAQKEAQKSTVPLQKDRGAPGVITRPAVPAVPGVIRSPVTAIKPETAAEMSDLMQDVERGIIRGKVKIVADDRTNILIIITRRENMTFFEQVIKVLDVETAPDIIVKIFRLEYADAEEIASTLNTLIGQVDKGKDKDAVKQPGGSGKPEEAGSVALRDYTERLERDRAAAASTVAAKEKSAVGELSAANIKILPDKRTNAILVMASKADLGTIDELIKSMDIMLSQVLVEAVIIEVNLSDSLTTGIDWVQKSLIAFDKKADGSRAPIFAFSGASGAGQPSSALSSVPASGAGLSYYFTHFGLNMDALVKLVATDGRARILQSPVIQTVDNKKAVIDVSTEDYFYNGQKPSGTDKNGATIYVDDVTTKKVGVNLTVTPHISAKKFVKMELTQKISNVLETKAIGNGTWPVVATRDVEASVAVQSGETIILGGLVENTVRKSGSKIPILGDIPLIGRLFSDRNESGNKRELVVFITPYVLNTAEEIKAEAIRRKEAVSMDGVWRKGWSASEIADPPRSDDRNGKLGRRVRGKPEKDEPVPAKKPATQPVTEPATEPATEPVPDTNMVENAAEEVQAPVVKNPTADIDPELLKTIERQDKRWVKPLKKVDGRVKKEIEQARPPDTP